MCEGPLLIAQCAIDTLQCKQLSLFQNSMSHCVILNSAFPRFGSFVKQIILVLLKHIFVNEGSRWEITITSDCNAYSEHYTHCREGVH